MTAIPAAITTAPSPDFVERQSLSPAFAASAAGWITDAIGLATKLSGVLRQTSTVLGLALTSPRIKSNLGPGQVMDWALRKREVGIAALGRTMLAACALPTCNADPYLLNLLRLAWHVACGVSPPRAMPCDFAAA